MSLKLVCRALFRRPLYLGDKEVTIQSLQINTSPAVLVDPENCTQDRPANREELEMFAKKYNPSFWHPDILGIEPAVSPSIFGMLARVYKTSGGAVEDVLYNPIWGLPRDSLILFVKNTEYSNK